MARAQSIAITLENSVLWVTIGDERSKNVLAKEIFRELGDLFDFVGLDDEVRVVVITGAGARFSTGGNVKGMAKRFEDGDPELLSRSSSIELLARMYQNMLHVDQPIIACINGDAVGAGATIALHCDILIAVEGSRIGDPHVLRGLVASAGAYIWPLVTSLNIAKEYLLTGDLMPIDEAYRLGVVNHVYTADELQHETKLLANRLAAGAPLAIRWTKRLLNRLALRQLNEILDDGIAHEVLTFSTEDHREGVESFLEKRPPTFKGR
jgi:enoyl-CoA hydratase